MLFTQISEGPSSVYGEDVALKLSSDRQLTYNQLKQDVFSFGAALHKEFGCASVRLFKLDCGLRLHT
jgi:hypothetical protein